MTDVECSRLNLSLPLKNRALKSQIKMDETTGYIHEIHCPEYSRTGPREEGCGCGSQGCLYEPKPEPEPEPRTRSRSRRR